MERISSSREQILCCRRSPSKLDTVFLLRIIFFGNTLLYFKLFYFDLEM